MSGTALLPYVSHPCCCHAYRRLRSRVYGSCQMESTVGFLLAACTVEESYSTARRTGAF